MMFLIRTVMVEFLIIYQVFYPRKWTLFKGVPENDEKVQIN